MNEIVLVVFGLILAGVVTFSFLKNKKEHDKEEKRMVEFAAMKRRIAEQIAALEAQLASMKK